MGNGIERTGQPGHGLVRIGWIRVVRIANAEGPGQSWRHLPGVLRVEVQVQEIVRLRIGQRKGCRGRGRHAVDELGQGGVVHQGDHARAEIVIVQAENPAVRAKPELVRSHGPGQVVVDEEAGGAASLNPRIVQPAERGERGVGAAALEDDRKRRQRFLKIGGSEQALVPGERGVEIVHQMPGEHVRVARCERVQGLRRDGVE